MTKKYIAVFVLFIVGILWSTAISIVNHELVHEQASVYMGCVDPHTHYGWTSYFQCKEYKEVLDADKEKTLYMADTLNEIVTYNNNSIIATLWLCASLLSVVIIMVRKYE